MEVITNLSLVYSLKQVTITKVIADLWNQPDVRNVLTKSLLQESNVLNNTYWMVSEKVKHLQIPEELKKDILLLVYPIGRHISGWVQSHNVQLYPGVYLPPELSWTSNGTLNRKEIARKLVADETLNVNTSYELACTYCLERDIPPLWDRMSQTLKKRFINIPFQVNPSVAFWTLEMQRRDAEASSKEIDKKLQPGRGDFIYAFKSAAGECNLAAVEFFLHKLTVWEKKFLLVDVMDKVLSSFDFRLLGTDMLRRLISEMDSSQQISVFQNHTVALLDSFLDWPNNDYFLKIVTQMWDYLSEEKFCKLLGIIARKAECSAWHESINFSELFVQIWQKGATDHKKYAICEGSSHFGKVFKHLPVNDICLILDDLDAQEKKTFIFSNQGRCLCRDLHRAKKYSTLSLFFIRCLGDENVALEFKKVLLEEDKEVFGFHGLNRDILNLCEEFISGRKKYKMLESGASNNKT